MADASVLQVVIFREGTLVGSEVFLPGEYAVGSDPGCELLLADGVVGSCAAFLSFRDGKITLQDVAGDGQVAINGVAQAMAELQSRDDVTIGPFLLKFRMVGQKRPAPAARPSPPQQAARPAPVPRPAPVDPDPPEVTIRATVPEVALLSGLVPPVQAVPPAPTNQTKPARSRPQTTPKPAPPPAPAAKAAPRPVSHPPEPKAQPAPRKASPAPMPAPAPAPAPRPTAAELNVTSPSPVPAHLPAVRMDGLSVGSLDSTRHGRHWRRMEPFLGARDFGPSAAELARSVAGFEGLDAPGPSLRVRVFWGKAAVGIYGFPFGRTVLAGPAETRDVPLYRFELPASEYLLAKCEGKSWVVRVPKNMRAFRFEPSGWKAAEGASDGEATKVPLEPGKLLRIGDAAYSVEVRVDRVKLAPRSGFKEFAASGALLPFIMVGILSTLLVLGVVFMPKYSRDSSDFTPQQMLRAAKAVLKPPEKKEEKKKEEKKEEKKKEEVKTEKPAEPKTKAQNVNNAIAAVKKVVSAGPAVESLLKATTKLAGGPKGYGDKGMGYKLSPLIGKPPIAMAGMGFGPGLGGFGSETKGIGAIRGMGGGGGGGIGAFAAGGTGKGKVAGTVVSAPSSGFHQRAGGGVLAKELIAKVINEHLGEVRGCYERALLKEAGLAGKLVLEWTIDLTGHVDEIKVKQATLKGADVPNCIVNSLKTWIFPKPTGGKVVVSYPFLFNSVGF